MVEVQNLTKRYGGHTAVQDLSFTVNTGEILGFLGPNGAGKTTTMNILTGYLSSTGGQAKICGIDVLEDPIGAKKKIGYLPEHPPLYLDMTVKEYLYFVYDLKKATLPKAAHIRELCGLVQITPMFNRLIKNLSKGYRQRVGLAGALIGNPEVIILDEPTVGLDPKQIIEIRTLIRKLGQGHTVILSSHILSEIQAVCDRVIVINNGILTADDTPENLSKLMSSDHRLTARIAGPEREVKALLNKLPGIVKVQSLGSKESGAFDFSIEAAEGQDLRRALFERLADRNWPLLGLKSSEMTLEDIFLKLTEEKKGTSKTKKSTERVKIELVEGEEEASEDDADTEKTIGEIIGENYTPEEIAEKFVEEMYEQVADGIMEDINAASTDTSEEDAEAEEEEGDE